MESKEENFSLFNNHFSKYRKKCLIKTKDQNNPTTIYCTIYIHCEILLEFIASSLNPTTFIQFYSLH